MRFLVAVFLVAMLAGCADNASEPTGHQMDHTGHDAMHMMQNVTFHDVTLDVTESVAGTFAPVDHATLQAVPFLLGLPTTNFQTHDVSQHFPVGVPVFVELSISGPPGLYTNLGSSDFADIWTSDCGDCAGGAVGTTWSGAVLHNGNTLTINVVETNSQVPRNAPYEVDMRISTAPDQIPSGIVLEVDMPEIGSHILFEPRDGDMPEVMVFDPDDVYVTTLAGGTSSQMYIEEGMATGAYAFLPKGHGAFYKLRSGGDVAAGDELRVEARILQQIIQTSGPQPAGAGGSATFNHAIQPLQTGLLMFGGLTTASEATTNGPEGFSLTINVPGPTFGFGVFAQTPMGHDELRPGEYTVSWESPLNDGTVQVQEFFTFYGR